MELSDEFKTLLIDTANRLKGSERRLFMAQTVQTLGIGGQRRAERELGWERKTIRKGTHELTTGITCCDAFHLRGRKSAEERLPNLCEDIKQIVDGQSQTDPQFRNNRLYTRLTSREVRHQLIQESGYTDTELPCEEVIRQLLNRMGYHLQKVKKSLPKKRYQKPTLSLTN